MDKNKMDKNKKNKFQQELYLRENPDAEIPENIEETLKNQYSSIVQGIGDVNVYKVRKFVSFCKKIKDDLGIAADTVSGELCAEYNVHKASLPPGCITILKAKLDTMGFDIDVSDVELVKEEYYHIKIKCKKGMTGNEENNEDRDTELSEPQEYSN